MRRNIRTSDLSYDLALLGGFYNMGLSMHEEGQASLASSSRGLYAA